MATSVVAVERIEYRHEFTASRAKLWKQQRAFLAVVDVLQKLVNVEQHCSQCREIHRSGMTTMVRKAHIDEAHHCKHRAVFVARNA